MDDLTIYITRETQLQTGWMAPFVSLHWNRGGEQKKKVSYVIVSVTGMIGSFMPIGGITTGMCWKTQSSKGAVKQSYVSANREWQPQPCCTSPRYALRYCPDEIWLPWRAVSLWWAALHPHQHRSDLGPGASELVIEDLESLKPKRWFESMSSVLQVWVCGFSVFLCWRLNKSLYSEAKGLNYSTYVGVAAQQH